MIIKIDIEKAYDALELNDILATFTKIGFTYTWISWIHSCISTIKFSFPINGEPSHWISTYEGVR